MTDNLALWNAVKRPPDDALKGFKRAGGFAGTAIKPMWSIRAMTEQFGPCGEGWGIGEPSFQTIQAGNELMVYCTVTVWHGKPECKVYGVGGDKVLAVNSNGPRSDDEAFKKAFTDAVTNALKHLGVGADIHMGLWDGSKYVDEKHETPANDGFTDMPPAHKPSKNTASRADYDGLKKGIEACASLQALANFRNVMAAQIDALPDDWKDHLRNIYADTQKALKEKLAA